MSQTASPKPDSVKTTLPPKPGSAKEFHKPVSWLVGRDLIAGLKWFALFAAFKGKLDPRDWMTANSYPDVDEKESPAWILELWRRQNHWNWQWKVDHDKYWSEVDKREPEFWKSRDAEEFWFDYIADSGDGQMGTYGVAYLCLSDMWAKKSASVGSEVSFEETADQTKLLPRGQFFYSSAVTPRIILPTTAACTHDFSNRFAGRSRALKRKSA